MGLILLALIDLDSNILVHAFDGERVISNILRGLFRPLELEPGAAVTGELTMAEVLAPAKAGKSPSVREEMEIYGAASDSGCLVLLPVKRDVPQATAALRERFAQKRPDAIHVVTTPKAGYRFLMSSHRDTRRLPSSIERVLPDDNSVAKITRACRG